MTSSNNIIHRFIIHANIPFSISENPYFLHFVNELWPSYSPSSRYTLSHSILDQEAARVQLEELDRLNSRDKLTLLFDGWEDRLRRSLYGAVVSEVNEYPVVLSLEDMTGQRATAINLYDAVLRALTSMGLEDGSRIIALVTDNPTVMQAFCTRFREKYYWVLVSTLFIIFCIFADGYYCYRHFRAFFMVLIMLSARLPHFQK